jgi:hypothetical protein
LCDLLQGLVAWFAHEGYLLEGLVEVVEIVDLESVESVLLYEIGDVLGAQQRVFPVESGQQVFLGEGSLGSDVAFGHGGFAQLLRSLFSAYVLHHEFNALGNELMSIVCHRNGLYFVVGLCQQLPVDDFVGVVVEGLKQWVFVIFALETAAFVFGGKSLIVPFRKLTGPFFPFG